MGIDIRYEIRRFQRQALSAGMKLLRGTQFESQAVAQVEPTGLELTRAGRRFYLGNGAAITGIAPVAALPTTAAAWVIYNAAQAGGRTIWLETLGMYLTSGTPAAGATLLCAQVRLPAGVSGAQYAGSSISGAAIGGTAPLGSVAVLKQGITVTDPAAPTWIPIADTPAPAVAFPGMSWGNRALAGRLAIQPGMGLALTVLSGAGTSPLYAPYAEWVELESEMD